MYFIIVLSRWFRGKMNGKWIGLLFL